MPRTWWSIRGTTDTLQLPPFCACCDAPTEATFQQIPFCAACREHTPRAGTWLLAALAGGAGAAAAYFLLPNTFPWAGVGLQAVLAFVIGALPGGLLALGRAHRPPGPAHVGREQAFEVDDETLSFRSRAYADRVGAANKQRPMPEGAPVLTWVERALPALAGVAGALVAIFHGPDWHFSLMVDNGSDEAIVLRAEEGARAEIPARSHLLVELPRRELLLHAVSAATGQVRDQQRLRPGLSDGTWFFNVGGRRCYELTTHVYKKGGGFALSGGGKPQTFKGHLFRVVGVSHWFEAAPSEIRVAVPRTGDTAAFGEHPRTFFNVVPCTPR